MAERFNTMIFKDECESGYSIKINNYMINIVLKDGIPCISKKDLSLAIDNHIFDKSWFGKILVGKDYDDSLLPLHKLEHTFISIDKSNKAQRGTIYLISDGEFTKIGMTDGKVEKRLSSLQTGNARELKLLGAYSTKNRFAQEKRLHSIFKDKHVTGEWFKLNKSDIKMILLSGDSEHKEKKSYLLTDEEKKDLQLALCDIIKEQEEKIGKEMNLLWEKYFFEVYGVNVDCSNMTDKDFIELAESYKKKTHEEQEQIDKKTLWFSRTTSFTEIYKKYCSILELQIKIIKDLPQSA